MKTNWRKKAILFLTSQSITLLGSSLVQMAIIWYVTLQTSSGLWTTILTLCSLIPQMLVSFASGVWADRYNRKKIIILSDALIAIATLALVIFMTIGNTNFNILIAIIIISIIRSIGTGIQTPTVNATIPTLVPQENLMKFNGFNSTVQSCVQFLSPILAGLILNFGKIQDILLIDIITGIIGIGIIGFIKIPSNPKKEIDSNPSFIEDLKQGLKYSYSNISIKTALIIYSLFILLSVPAGFLTALNIERTFGNSYTFLSINEIIGFAGMVLGGLLLGTWGGFKDRNKTLILGIITYAICSIILGFSTEFILFVSIMFVLSFSIPIVQTATMTMIQEKASPKMQGRMFGLLSIIYSGFMPIGMLIFGPLADFFAIKYLLFISGGLLLLTGLIITSKLKSISCNTIK